MSTGKHYRYVCDIPNADASSYIPDVSFHPNGSAFAVTYRDNNQVRLFDSATRKLLRAYENPSARLDWPHGVIMTDRHIIVSNKLNPPSKPSILTVYRIDNPADDPVTVFPTPVEHLREAHSLALHKKRLLATYCGKDIGALVTYGFDDETGEISGPIDITESWFSEFGEPKGVCFNARGTQAVITFVTEAEASGKASEVEGCATKNDATTDTRNGIAIFDVTETGMLSSKPVYTKLESHYCRLENIDIKESLCAVADPLNDQVSLYQFQDGHFPDKPIHVIQNHLSFPHDACFSPDRKMLVVTNNGIQVVDRRILWRKFTQPRSDRVTIFELHED